MATIWKLSAGEFVARPLQAVNGAALVSTDGHEEASSGFRIVPFRDGTRPSHALIAAADVETRINGWLLVGGIRALQHKDELVMGSQRMFFSSESTPVVETYLHDGLGRRPRCPVCRADIADGQTMVCCPGCARIYHQLAPTEDAPEKPCWTYSAACRFCEHPTSLSGEPTWRSDELEDL